MGQQHARPARRHHRLLTALVAVLAATAALVGVGVAPAAAAGPRLDLRVLLIGGGVSDPTTAAWERELERIGVAYRVIRTPSASDPVTRDQLVDPADPTHGYFNGVVLGTESSLFWGGLDEVYRYEQEFRVRQLDGFEYPRAQVGQVELDDQTADRNLSGRTATMTSAGKAAFPYLRGPVPIDTGAYGYLAVATSPDFTPHLTVNNGANPILGVYQHPADDPSDPKAGVAEMVMTVNYSDSMLHWRLLGRGMISWVTKGASLGLVRNYLANQVDDVLIPDDLWDVAANCTPGDDSDCPAGSTATPRTVRMNAADVTATMDWQTKYGVKLDLAFNASGAVAGDALTAALLKNKSSFRWINHTWDHPFLGCRQYVVPADKTSGCAVWPSTDEIASQISKNQQWAAKSSLPAFRKQELVTGEHSGLDNPNMPAALAKTGIQVIAADASRQPTPYAIGSAVTVPRYPSNVYYNVSTWEEQLDEYNYIYLPPSLGGACVNTSTTTCRTAPATKEEFIASEARSMMGQVLSTDPRVGYSHQSNLSGDRILLSVLGRVLDNYNTWFKTNTPVVSTTLSRSSTELTQQGAWTAALAAGRVEAWTEDGQVTVAVVSGTSPVFVPVTVPTGTMAGTVAFGTAYAGARSAWQQVAPGSPLVLTLPAA
ncbi:MAG: hypothetical protein M3Q27_14440 [Actinomycetota bacterium]|nr:hypothetical protein [Actinomycetota bacterium]